ncbi:MAG: hypothetical protein J5I65_13475, partial [Aridibacter famidurans]|nr:hypothetical protein [Aridibacter famidurans]
NIYKKLKTGVRRIAHVQAANETWRSGKEWRSDDSLKGKVRLRYGLHCFGRSEEEYEAMIRGAGFHEPVFEAMKDLMPGGEDDLDGQLIVTAAKG